MKTGIKYPTRPLASMAKLNEIRRKYATRMWSARERGEILIVGVAALLHSLPAGLGEFHFMGGMGPNSGRIVADKQLLARCLQASERMGFSDICGTLRTTLGAMELGVFDLSRTGDHVRPDFAWDPQRCPGEGKTSQLWHEYYGIPAFTMEMPPTVDQKDYLIAQMNECIEWMEKTTGRKYHDELLIDGVKNEWETRMLYADIVLLQKSIPAPIDQATLFSVRTIAWRGGRHRRDTVEVYRGLRDEVQERVRDGIAANPFETGRLMYEGLGSWYPSSILKYPRCYGASYVGSQNAFVGHGHWVVRDDMSMEKGPTLAELGLELRTRSDALDALAELYLRYDPAVCTFYHYDVKAAMRAKLYKDWKADGVVVEVDAGCRGGSAAAMETVWMCKQNGIPCTYYEGSRADPADLGEAEYHNRFEALMESMGLKRMTEAIPERADDD